MKTVYTYIESLCVVHLSWDLQRNTENSIGVKEICQKQLHKMQLVKSILVFQENS